MNNEATMGRVLPFERSPEYLRRLAVKQRGRGSSVQALETLRLSLRQAPGDARTVLEIADTYAGMQCLTLSNRALFSLLLRDEVSPECFYGVGCNLYAMRMRDCARDCLVLYLKKRPEGKFVSEAVDLIEAVDSEERGGSAPERRINTRVERALRSLDEGRPSLAARQIRRALPLERRSSGVHALLSFALLGAGNVQEALDSARRAMRCCRADIRALCALAASLKAAGSGDTARVFLGRAVAHMEDGEDTQLVCQTACEMGEHTCVREALMRLEAQAPLSDELLHLLAAACHNTGDAKEAIRRWRLLLRIDPMDSVAEYRLRQAEEGLLSGSVSYVRQVPLQETLARLSRLRGWVQEGRGALLKRWQDGEELERLLRWGLAAAEPGVPQAMMGVLLTLGDERAVSALRDVLSDTAGNDALKHSALATLCLLGAKGPFYALIGGRLTLVNVSRSEEKLSDLRLRALTAAVMGRISPASDEDEARVAALCRVAIRQPDVLDASFRLRGVELAARWLRGERVTVSARPSRRRRLERYARRILKGAHRDEVH